MTPLFKKKEQQLKEISNATLIEEGGHARLIKWGIIFLSVMLLIFILWASFTKIDEVAVSFGDIQPANDIQVIQHLEGGIVQQVLVRNGDEVHQGQLLLKFDPSAINAELLRTQSREISLVIDAERLRAFVHKIPAAQVDWSRKVIISPYNTVRNTQQINDLIQAGVALLQEQNAKRKNQESVLMSQISQRQALLDQFTQNLEITKKQLELSVREEKMFSELVSKGHISERDYITIQRKTNEIRAQVSQLDAQIVQAKNALIEVHQRLEEADTNLDKEALEELVDTEALLLETRHTIERLNDIVQRIGVKAPVTGIVKGLTISPGSVVRPGEKIMEVIPTEGELLVISKVSTRDIGHIRVGDPVEVKVLTYDFARYGGIKGTLDSVSASTFTSEDGLPYYRAKITLSKSYVGSDPQQNQLKPGMTAQADIITGKKTIMEYLLKPITRGLEASFKER